MISSRTRAASALPRVAFMTAPIRTPAACTLPSRMRGNDVRVVADGRINRLKKRCIITDNSQPARGHDLVRLPLAVEHALDDLAGQPVVQRPAGHQLRDARDLGGGDRQR